MLLAKTEHVMVRSRHGQSDADLKTLILKRVEKKLAKGEAYAKEKTLIVFLGRGCREQGEARPDPLDKIPRARGMWRLGRPIYGRVG